MATTNYPPYRHTYQPHTYGAAMADYSTPPPLPPKVSPQTCYAQPQQYQKKRYSQPPLRQQPQQQTFYAPPPGPPPPQDQIYYQPPPQRQSYQLYEVTNPVLSRQPSGQTQTAPSPIQQVELPASSPAPRPAPIPRSLRPGNGLQNHRSLPASHKMLPTLNTSCSPAHKPVFQPYNPGSTLTRNSYLHKRAARSRASLPAGSKYQAYQPPALFTPARPVTAATTSPSPTTSEESADADLMWREVAGAVGLAMTPVEQSVQRGTPVRVGTTKVPPMQVASLVTATPEPPPSPDLLATPADGSTLAVPQTPALARMVRRTLTFQYEEVENAVEDEYTDEFEEVVNCEELAAEYQSLIGGGW